MVRLERESGSCLYSNTEIRSQSASEQEDSMHLQRMRRGFFGSKRSQQIPFWTAKLGQMKILSTSFLHTNFLPGLYVCIYVCMYTYIYYAAFVYAMIHVLYVWVCVFDSRVFFGTVYIFTSTHTHRYTACLPCAYPTRYTKHKHTNITHKFEWTTGPTWQ